ncbi:nitrogen-specific signal transduction histidine kinase/CheY-like chemotaxis protein [Paenibacillus sp. SORGH_AS306]|uniref:sensor histidine kinase n=1 Tax=unclassified Paenibacillus TaxID=185978 RepID=UPI00278B835B|nr:MULTISPECIES: ATP-binding protein [unclassified Paenibacillus]MDQ1235971.1 nitrogen-specific signal transduction histidine kinase/CheY-like chemotaxis protein [Paenibacillus sp. SORGH_AS_0306]MDR6113020.1 nitrogen-specific signal transduction histidine kinase/CheY-like chemotaxis protein [Paenibacillus sp. SORGH_AS_0338]
MNNRSKWSIRYQELEVENIHLKSLIDEHLEYRNLAEQTLRHNAEFLAMLSHEIRTSMNAILSLTALLEQTSVNTEQRYYLDLMNTSNVTLVALVNNILDLSKMEAGKMQLDHDPFDLINVIEDLLYSVSPRAFQKEVEVILAIESEIPLFVMGDALKVRQMIMNLVQNSIKFTHKGEIQISLLMLESAVELASVQIIIRDTGIGMSATQLSHLFHNYSQVHKSDDHHYGGTGLGLAITKQLIELMNGKIEVKSEVDIGTEISIVFNFKKYMEVPAIPFKKDLLSLMNVMVLDQNKTSSQLICNLLIEWGASVTYRLEMNEEFFEDIQESTYDLILIDLRTINPHLWEREKANLKKQPLAVLAPLGDKVEGEFKDMFKAVITKPIRKLHLLNGVLAVEID